jgi:hypothetical protein
MNLPKGPATQDGEVVAAIEVLRQHKHLLPSGNSQFVYSLLSYHERWGYVTTNQRPHLIKLAERCLELAEKNNPTGVEEVFNGAAIRKLLDKAASNGLKYPTLKFQLPDIPGDRLYFYRASAR